MNVEVYLFNQHSSIGYFFIIEGKKGIFLRKDKDTKEYFVQIYHALSKSHFNWIRENSKRKIPDFGTLLTNNDKKIREFAREVIKHESAFKNMIKFFP